MNAIGFAPVASDDDEVDKLREACKRLNFTIRAIKDAQTSLGQINLGQARERLNNAQWQAREAKKLLAEVGRRMNGTKIQQRPPRNSRRF